MYIQCKGYGLTVRIYDAHTWRMPATPGHLVRMDDELWAELGELAANAGTDRSAVLRELAAGWIKRQRRLIARQASNAT